jgi:hypothetical protein
MAVPRGRHEYGPSFSLPDWVRLHNTHGKGGTVELNGRFHAAECECAVHARSG